jgi:NTP pyrophosphatase (non-canonical NTP hydrolase)
MDRVIEDIVTDAFNRAKHSMERYPSPNCTITKIAEEAGEVVKAAVHATEGRDNWGNIREEIVDSIAMHMRLVIEGDQVHGLPPMPIPPDHLPEVRAEDHHMYDDYHDGPPLGCTVLLGPLLTIMTGLLVILAMFCDYTWFQ